MTAIHKHPEHLVGGAEAAVLFSLAAGARPEGTDIRLADDALDAAGGGFFQEIGRVFKKAFTEPPKRYATPEEWHQAHRGEIVTTIPTIWGDRY
ncbi:hypothetical protein [Methylorubrum zatmanii]